MVAVDRYNNGNDRVTGILVIVTFIGVLGRQYPTIRDNVTLTSHLENRERELQRATPPEPAATCAAGT